MALMKRTGGTKTNMPQTGQFTDAGFDLLYNDPESPRYMGSFTPLAGQQAYYTEAALGEIRGATGEAQQTLQDYYSDAMGMMGDARGALTGAEGQALMDLSKMRDTYGAYDPYARAGQGALNRLSGGMGGALNRASQIAQPLIDERKRGVSSDLAAAGLSRSGAGINALADVSQQTLMDIAQQDYMNQQNLANMGLSATGAQTAGQAGALGQMAQTRLGTGQGLASLYGTQAGMAGDMGSQLAGTQLGLGSDVAGLYGTMGQNLMDLYIARMQKNAAVDSGDSGMMGALGQLGGEAIQRYSDVRLKKNIKPLFSKNGVNFYSFEANEEGERVGMDMTEGVLAQEVEKVHPDLVSERDGYKQVNYGELIKRVG